VGHFRTDIGKVEVAQDWPGLSETGRARRLGLALQDNLVLGAIFTAASLLRSYALRRLFERLRAAGLARE
jgi:hypothetical protein